MKRLVSILYVQLLSLVICELAAAQDFQTQWNVPTGGSVRASGTATLIMSLSPITYPDYIDPRSTHDYYRGAGGATRYNSVGMDIASQSQYMIFRDPQSPRNSSWLGQVFSDSVGWSWYTNDRGTQTSGADANFVRGSVGLRAAGGGSIKLVPASQLAGTPPGVFRYQALDTAYVVATGTSTSGSSYVQDGRATYSGSIVWSPPLTQSGYARYTADLVVSIRFGIDGIVTGGLNQIPPNGGLPTPAYTAARQLDLDVLVAPTVIDMDGRQSIKVRKTGQGPGTFPGSGWTYSQLHQTSTVFLKDDTKGTSSTAAINWGNSIKIMQQTAAPYRWPVAATEYRLRGIELPAAQSTPIRISCVTSNASVAARERVAGEVRFPDLPGLRGNGIDFSVRLDNLRPVTP